MLAGVTLPPPPRRGHRGPARRARAAGRHGRRRRGGPRRAAPHPARPGHLHRQGQGRGAARQLAEAVDCDTVVFDDELSPAQQHNLEKILGRTAIDRTAVILDIFAQNASSQEGKAQVELALHRYRLPRLRGKGGVALAAGRWPGGGLGARRGPGETKLEVDRRRDPAPRPQARGRPARRHPAPRDPAQAARSRSRVTRASPSSATPTPASPRCSTSSPTPACWSRTASSPRSTPPPAGSQLPGGEAVLVTDTVGFVRKLPHQLVEAFRSTLQVAADADLLVHVVDASAADPDGPDGTPSATCSTRSAPARSPSCSASTRPTITEEAKRLVDRHPGSVAISAPHRRGHRRPARWPSATGCGRTPPRSSCTSPTPGATCWPRSTARARSSARRPPTTACSCGPGSTTPAAPSWRPAWSAGRPAARIGSLAMQAAVLHPPGVAPPAVGAAAIDAALHRRAERRALHGHRGRGPRDRRAHPRLRRPAARRGLASRASTPPCSTG